MKKFFDVAIKTKIANFSWHLIFEETDSEKTIRFFCHIFMITGILIGSGGGQGPSGYAYEPKYSTQFLDIKELSSS